MNSTLTKWDPAGLRRDPRYLQGLRDALKGDLSEDKRKGVESMVRRITDLNGDPEMSPFFFKTS